MNLTDKRIGTLTWIINKKGREWSIYELEKNAKTLDYSATHTFVKELERNGFVTKNSKTNQYTVSNVRPLIQSISLFKPFKAKKKIRFFVPGSMSKKLKLLKKQELDYVLTLFAGAELILPYVKTEDVHAYILERDAARWMEKLLKSKVRRAEGKDANLFLLIEAQKHVFELAQNIHNHPVAPMAVLLADLFSFGGIGEEQANEILKEWIKR